jgi:hypothetical protein
MRFFQKDTLDAIVDILDDNFNTMIATIRTERSDTTIPDCNLFTSGLLQGNIAFPQCKISFVKEEIIEDETLSDKIDEMETMYYYNVMFALMDNTASLEDHCCYYIEACQRVLQGYYDNDITWIRCKGSEIGQITDSEQNETYKGISLQFEVRV